MKEHYSNNSRERSNKDGLIRSLLTVIIGVIILSYIGFDLRAQIDSFQNEYVSEIRSVDSFIQNIIVPRAEEFVESAQDFAEDNYINEGTIDTFIDFIRSIFDKSIEE